MTFISVSVIKVDITQKRTQLSPGRPDEIVESELLGGAQPDYFILQNPQVNTIIGVYKI